MQPTTLGWIEHDPPLPPMGMRGGSFPYRHTTLCAECRPSQFAYAVQLWASAQTTGEPCREFGKHVSYEQLPKALVLIANAAVEALSLPTQQDVHFHPSEAFIREYLERGVTTTHVLQSVLALAWMLGISTWRWRHQTEVEREIAHLIAQAKGERDA